MVNLLASRDFLAYKLDCLSLVSQGEKLSFAGVHAALRQGASLSASRADGGSIALQHALSPRQVEMLLAGGVISWLRLSVTA
jgi:aconitate hydratase